MLDVIVNMIVRGAIEPRALSPRSPALQRLRHDRHTRFSQSPKFQPVSSSYNIED